MNCSTKKICLVSQPFIKANKLANIEIFEKIISAHNDIDLFLFPELSIIGGLWKNSNQDYIQLAEHIPSGESIHAITRLAKRYNTTICTGLVEVDESNNYFMTHFMCDMTGFLGKQQKFFPGKHNKENIFRFGKSLTSITLWNQHVAILACGDILLPEPAILAGKNKVSMILSPTDCFDSKQSAVVSTLLQSRALDTGAIVIASFGHDYDNFKFENDKVLAAIVCDPSLGIPTINRQRKINDTAIITADVSCKEPPVRFIEPETRFNIIFNDSFSTNMLE